jgi:hypothetical protein
MAVTVDQAKLVLNTFAATFQNNLIAADLVSWNQYDGEMNDRDRLTVAEQVGPRYNVVQTVNGVADLTTGVQDTVFGSEQFTVNRTFNSSMGWGDFVKIRDIGDARESEAIKNAATHLAEVIDGYILGVTALAANNWVGTPGNNVATWNDIAAGYTRLKEEGVDDADLRVALTYGDKQALGNTIVQQAAFADGMASGVYRKGFDSTVDGIPALFTQQLPNLTMGSRTSPAAMNGAAQNVNYSAVSVSAAPGQYLSQTININGVGTTSTVKDGEVFTIAGVFAWDNRLGQTLAPRLQQFRVIGDYTATGGAIANMRIFPAIIVPGSGTGGDIGVNTANATVDSVPGATAAINFVGTASTAYKPRVLVQKQAIVVNTKDLIMPATGIGSRKQLTKVPLSIRMWQNSDFNTGNHSVRFDCALTANVRDRRRLVRINGS